MSDMTNEAKVGDGPLCGQMQALQERARKLHPIDLHDPQLDTADPYTRLFLLAEYWQRQAKEARALLERMKPANVRAKAQPTAAQEIADDDH